MVCSSPFKTVATGASEADLNGGNVNVSPSGTYRVAAIQDQGTSTWFIYLSADQGATWTQITAPDTTSGGLQGNYRVAVTDGGTIYAARKNGASGDKLKFWIYTGSWSAGVDVVTGMNGNNEDCHYVGTDGSTIVVLHRGNSALGRMYRSTNGGTSFTIDTGGANVPGTLALQEKQHVAWIGGKVHVAAVGSDNVYHYWRYDPATNAWLATTTAPSWPISSSARGVPRVMSRHGSTSEVWIGLFDWTSGANTIYLFKTTDSGANWSTVCSNESLGATWDAAAQVFQNTGLTMGSDDLLHIWGQVISPSPPPYDVKTMTRDLAGTGTYGTIQTAGAPPNSGRGTNAAADYTLYPWQRQDGTHDRVFDIVGIWYTTTAGAAPTELLLVTCAVTTAAYVPPLRVGQHDTGLPPGIAGPPLRAGPKTSSRHFSPRITAGRWW